MIKMASASVRIEKFETSLTALGEAYAYAKDSGSSAWDFAVSIETLYAAGLNDNDLRWLVRKGYVEHGREVTREGDDVREFRSTGRLIFSDQTCFILTDVGIAWSLKTIDYGNKANSNDQPSRTSEKQVRPLWDAESRRLRVNGQIVKCFKWPASNQEAVLCAFQEEGWPERIDDPLPPQPEQDSKRRLADTIKCLNRKQANELIHFRGDGTGEGVVWERVDRNWKTDDS